MTDTSDRNESRPEWWSENEHLREEMDIPPYTPPRFVDDVYTHTVVAPLEERYDCTIRFFSPDAADWQVRVDGEPVLTVGRHRDEKANTVYEIESTAFRDAIEEHLG